MSRTIQKVFRTVQVKVHGIEQPLVFEDNENTNIATQIWESKTIDTSDDYVPFHAIERIQVTQIITRDVTVEDIC